MVLTDTGQLSGAVRIGESAKFDEVQQRGR